MKFKCVSIEAVLKCSNGNGTTTFVKSSNIAKVDNIELATTADMIEPFPGDACRQGCFSGTKPCTPALNPWTFIASHKKVGSVELLIEKSIAKCTTKDAFITIDDVKQDTVIIDLSGVIINAINKTNEMLDFRMDQYENDPDKFKECFEKWFGKGHSAENIQKIVDRMKATRALTSKLINEDGSLNEDHFILEPEDENNAYVYPNDKNHEIHLSQGSFSQNKPTSGFGTLSGTIAHESSHFNDIGGTDDHAYWGKVQPLAKTDPDKALNNAASFSFFLESGATCNDY